jgi:hypothetical protein
MIRSALQDKARYQVRQAIVETDEERRLYISVTIGQRNIKLTRNDGRTVWLDKYRKKWGFLPLVVHADSRRPDGFVRPVNLTNEV